jgi:hypothetical protein
VRPSGLNPLLPVWGRSPFLWKRFNAGAATEAHTPAGQHPQVTDQGFLTSWNNKQAKGYAAPDTDTPYTSIFRSQLLDARVRSRIRGRRKTSPAGLVNAMEDAGTVDLRADRVLPYLLRVVGRPGSKTGRRAVAALRSWQKAGSHRIDRNADGTYEHAAAIRIMDAWWPRVASAVFRPALGATAYGRLVAVDPRDNVPNNGGDHLGSSWDVGFYGTVQKDLRAVLGRHVGGRLSRLYCGGGKRAPRGRRGRRTALRLCRGRLRSALLHAALVPASKVYPGDKQCSAGNQTCWDKVLFRPLGAITQPLIPWVNRPTFQQVVHLTG